MAQPQEGGRDDPGAGGTQLRAATPVLDVSLSKPAPKQSRAEIVCVRPTQGIGTTAGASPSQRLLRGGLGKSVHMRRKASNDFVALWIRSLPPQGNTVNGPCK